MLSFVIEITLHAFEMALIVVCGFYPRETYAPIRNGFHRTYSKGLGCISGSTAGHEGACRHLSHFSAILLLVLAVFMLSHPTVFKVYDRIMYGLDHQPICPLFRKEAADCTNDNQVRSTFAGGTRALMVFFDACPAHIPSEWQRSADFDSLGRQAAQRGNINEAIRAEQEAIRLNDKNAAAHWYLGADYCNSHEHQKCMIEKQYAERLDPNYYWSEK